MELELLSLAELHRLRAEVRDGTLTDPPPDLWAQVVASVRAQREIDLQPTPKEKKKKPPGKKSQRAKRTPAARRPELPEVDLSEFE